jgi:hypothetical protein
MVAKDHSFSIIESAIDVIVVNLADPGLPAVGWLTGDAEVGWRIVSCM